MKRKTYRSSNVFAANGTKCSTCVEQQLLFNAVVTKLFETKSYLMDPRRSGHPSRMTN